MKIILKKRDTSHDNFIKTLFFEFKSRELALDHLPDELKAQMLGLQFDSHESHYRNNFPDADDFIIIADNKPAGRLILLDSEKECHIADLILLESFQNKGVGSYLCNRLISETGKENKKLSLKVSKTNTTIEFYKKFGFKAIKDDGPDLLMAIDS